MPTTVSLVGTCPTATRARKHADTQAPILCSALHLPGRAETGAAARRRLVGLDRWGRERGCAGLGSAGTRRASRLARRRAAKRRTGLAILGMAWLRRCGAPLRAVAYGGGSGGELGREAAGRGGAAAHDRR